MQDIKTYSKLKCFIFHEEIHNLNYERLAIVIMLKGELHSIAKGFYNLKKNMVTDITIYPKYENWFCDRMLSEYIEDRTIKLYFEETY